MKKSLIRTIIIISIIYTIISSFYTIFYKAITQENMEIIEVMERTAYNVTLETNTKKQIGIEQRKIIEMLDINISLIIISIILGIIINLIIEAKENIKIKYILYFIFGNIIYNIFWMGMVHFIIGYPMSTYNIINKYIDTMKSVFIPYVLLYIIFIVVNILINKSRVNELNETLNGKAENKKKKYIINTIIIILSIVLLVFIFYIGIKSYVLIKHSSAIEEFNKNKNYYVEEIFENSKRNYYYKDGVLKEKSGESIYYYNAKENKSISVLERNKALILEGSVNTPFNIKPVYNHLFGDSSKRIWSNIIMSFNIKLNSEKIDGISYYVIERDSQKFYIDKETFLLKRIVSINQALDSETGKLIDKESIIEYVYKVDYVTDEHIAIPDLSNYEVYTDLEELVEVMNSKNK